MSRPAERSGKEYCERHVWQALVVLGPRARLNGVRVGVSGERGQKDSLYQMRSGSLRNVHCYPTGSCFEKVGGARYSACRIGRSGWYESNLCSHSPSHGSTQSTLETSSPSSSTAICPYKKSLVGQLYRGIRTYLSSHLSAPFYHVQIPWSPLSPLLPYPDYYPA